MAGGDLAIKMRVLGDMLTLIDAIPDAGLRNAPAHFGDGLLTGGDAAAASPESVLSTLHSTNAIRAGQLNASADGTTCARRWRLGGCRHCPTQPQVASLWRVAAERRRARGWQPLVPSDDSEWASLATAKDGQPATDGGPATAPPTPDALQKAWVRVVGGDAGCPGARSRASPECVYRRWDAMLCAPGEVQA